MGSAKNMRPLSFWGINGKDPNLVTMILFIKKADQQFNVSIFIIQFHFHTHEKHVSILTTLFS